MSIALAKKNPHLRACILDIAPVCEIAAGNVRRARLSRRVTTLAGDIRRTLPAASTPFWSATSAPCRASFSRTPGAACRPGTIDPGGPLPVRRRNPAIGPPGRAFHRRLLRLATRSDMVQALKSRGFRAVKARNFHQDVWCITGSKRARRMPDSAPRPVCV